MKPFGSTECLFQYAIRSVVAALVNHVRSTCLRMSSADARLMTGLATCASVIAAYEPEKHRASATPAAASGACCPTKRCFISSPPSPTRSTWFAGRTPPRTNYFLVAVFGRAASGKAKA